MRISPAVTLTSGRVTAIIPTHNRATLVRRAIESVLRQTAAERCDVVVVDDGSTDETPAMLAAYRPRVRCVRTPGRGVSAARNAGLAGCTTEFVAFLDDDDAWEPDKIARQLAAFARWPATVLVAGRVLECRPDGTSALRAMPAVPLDRPADMAAEFFVTNFVPPSAAMLRTSVLWQTGGFHEELHIAEDYHLWVRVACRGPAVVLSDVVTRYSSGSPGSLSGRGVRALTQQLRARYLLKSKLRAHSCGAAVRRERHSAWRRGVLRSRTDLRDVCFRAGDFSRAARYGLQALLQDPLGRAPWEWRRCGEAAVRSVLG